MGVLEDAIREHLELKRRHGASEEEVERKELEALGPARREFEAPAEETADDADHSPEPEPEAEEPAAAEPEPELEPEPLAHEPPPEPLPEPEAATRIHESPIPDPALTDPRGPDFMEEEEPEEPEPEPRRDFDFD